MKKELNDNLTEKQDLRSNIKRRLRRIEGQMKGIERMIDQDACCMDVLIQISAVRAATTKVGMMILENHINCCLYETLESDNKNTKETLDELLKVMNNFIK